MLTSLLWLASWYPNRKDAFDGDFIERHAIAASRFTNITLLFVSKDEGLKKGAVEIEKTVAPNLTVYKVYYGRSGWGGVVEKIWSYGKYLQLQKKMYRQIVAESGPPAIVHVQVAMKAGMLARWLNKKYRIPFVVTEHWTGYYPDSIPNIYNGNPFIREINKKILQEAALFLPVSDNLGQAVNEHFVTIPYRVVPDTVNTSLFFYQPAVPGRFRFIHPSSMGYQKNPEGILAACKLVKEGGYDFELLMVGNNPAALVSLCRQYGLNGQVYFEAAVPYPEVAARMRQSSALLMFSRFETLSCVVMEALSCGLPVISSRVGGVPELVSSDNGLLVENENVQALAAAMMQLMDSYNGYNRELIASKATALFNYEAVGRQYAEVYQHILER